MISKTKHYENILISLNELSKSNFKPNQIYIDKKTYMQLCYETYSLLDIELGNRVKYIDKICGLRIIIHNTPIKNGFIIRV